MDVVDDTRIKKQFGARVRAVRKARGMSQEALALKCGLDRTYIGGVERGERNVSLVNIFKIGAGLTTAASYLMHD